jgi:hypothetical protein
MRCVNRWARMAVALLAVTSFIVLGAGVAVPPNQEPAPALKVANWACYQTGVLPSDILSGDFDDDGWLELAASCFGTGNVYFYDNLGSRATSPAPGVFLCDASSQTPVGALPGAAALALSEEGVYVLSDTMIPGTTPQLNAVVMKSPLKAGVGLPAGTVDITSADLNHEGRIDDVIEVQDLGASQVLDVSDGTVFPLTVGLAFSVGAVVGDMNRDGWQDVVILTSSGLSIAYNCGGIGSPNTYFPAVVVANGNAALGIQDPKGVAVADFDGDGLLDIVVVGNNTQGDMVTGYARVFLNSPTAVGSAFTPLPSGGPMTTWGFDAVGVVAADMDGNGRDDFAVVNKGSDTVAVFLSDALSLQVDDRATTDRCLSDADRKADRLQIQFRMYKLELQCGHQPVAAAVGDFDFNGKLDIAVAHLSVTPEARPQASSCIEVLFDVAGGFYQSGNINVPNQTPHSQIAGVAGMESTTCTGCPSCSAASSGSGSGN